MNDEAKRRISLAIEQKNESLNLGNLNLEYLELPVDELSHITELRLSFNKLSKLPDNISLLPKLDSIYLNSNKFDSFPDVLFHISELNLLDLESNDIFIIPNDIEKLDKLITLDVSDNKISNLPQELFKLVNLSNLSLANNKLIYIPDEISYLTDLSSLYLQENNLTKLPETIGNLKDLFTLVLANNGLTELPSSISMLDSLRIIDLENNQLETISESIGLLINLDSLDLTNNKLSELPESIGSLKNLRALYISDNFLCKLPESFGSLERLETLRLNNNKIKKLPESFTNLPKLKNLYINDNSLDELPKNFGTLNKLLLLNINNNNLSSFPDELKLVSQSNSKLILDYRGNPFVENALLRSESFVKVWNGVPFHLRDLLKIYFEGFSTFYSQKTQKNIEFNISNRADALFFEFLPNSETDPEIVQELLNQYFDILKNKLAETVSLGQIIPRSSSDNAEYFAQVQVISFTNNLTHIRSTIEDHISDRQIIAKVSDIITEAEDEFRRAANTAIELNKKLLNQNTNAARLLGENSAIKDEIAYHRNVGMVRAETPPTNISIEQKQSLSFQQTINNHIGDEFYSLKEKLDAFLTSHQKEQAEKLNEQIDKITAKTNPTPEEKTTLAKSLRRWVESVKKTIAVGKDIGEVGEDLLKGWDKVKDFSEKILHDPQLVEAVKDISETIQQAM